jgi:hypothetical protein
MMVTDSRDTADETGLIEQMDLPCPVHGFPRNYRNC